MWSNVEINELCNSSLVPEEKVTGKINDEWWGCWKFIWFDPSINTYSTRRANRKEIHYKSGKLQSYNRSIVEVFHSRRMHPKQTHKCYITFSHGELAFKTYREKTLRLLLSALVCNNLVEFCFYMLLYDMSTLSRNPISI